MAELFAVVNGKRRSLARETAQLAPGQWYRLALRVDGRRLTGLIDDHPVVTASAEPGVGGQAGLYGACTDGVTFDPVSARYVRVCAIKPDGPEQPGSQMSIVELKVYE